MKEQLEKTIALACDNLPQAQARQVLVPGLGAFSLVRKSCCRNQHPTTKVVGVEVAGSLKGQADDGNGDVQTATPHLPCQHAKKMTCPVTNIDPSLTNNAPAVPNTKDHRPDKGYGDDGTLNGKGHYPIHTIYCRLG